MKQKKYTISKKITLLNKTILDSMTEKHSDTIVKNFTETGIKVLAADFGFAWWKSTDSNEYKLAYKSLETPYNPFLPKKISNHHKAIKTKKLIFDNNVKSENYRSRGLSDISPYMKSFIIIPIHHDNYIYGSLTLCYKKRHDFTEEELTLSEAIGHTTAQAITIHRLLKTDTLLREEKLKTEFIANATHELRTPLAIMKGNIGLALRNKINLKSTHKVLKEINTEINILSDILKDLSLITSGDNIKHVMSSAPVNITDLISYLVKRLKNMTAEKKIRIKIKNQNGGPFFVSGDEMYLEKLFINLIKNAITYGKQDGNITIELSTEKSELKIKIIDNGIGISKEDLLKIFDRFYRGDKARTRDTRSNHSGLGLTIAKWATEIHGGKIQGESVLGKGSTFTVTLPRLVSH